MSLLRWGMAFSRNHSVKYGSVWPAPRSRLLTSINIPALSNITEKMRIAAFGVLRIAIVIAILAAGILGTRIIALEQPLSTAAAFPSLGYILVVSSMAAAATVALLPRRTRRRIILLAAVLILFAVLNAVDLTFLYYFNQPVIALYHHLPRSAPQLATLPTYWTYFYQYVPPYFVALSLVCMLPVIAAVQRLAGHSPNIRYCAIALMVVTLCGVHLTPRASRPGIASLPLAANILEIDPTVPRKPLQAVDRHGSFAVTGAPRYKPRTIVLTINESVSYFFSSSQDQKLSLADRLIALSGDRQSWHTYDNAVTNSSCTDVSIPSILTGSGSHESFDNLHRLPFVFDMAKARGYRTAFYTSAVMEWANLSTFLADAPIDSFLSASSLNLPLINDLSGDDIIAMKKLVKFIDESDGNEDLFIVTYSHAMHAPFQAQSIIEFPPGLTDRRSRALYVLETEHRMLFDALRAAGRFDDALIILTADHGRRVRPKQRQFIVPRVLAYDEETLRVPLLIKAPANLPATLAAALRANTAALVSNLDIAPTIADLLGARLQGGLIYGGHSLLGEVPPNRLSVATSTNEWRSWPRTAIALARKNDRFVCNQDALCEYHSAVPAEEARMSHAQRAAKHLQYMREALEIPIIAQNISAIYHAHFGLDWRPPGSVRTASRRDMSFKSEALWATTPPGAILHAPAGHAPGHLMYGPYWNLRPGHYDGEVSLELGPGGGEGADLCAIDVFDGEKIVGAQRIGQQAPAGPQRAAIPFSVPDDKVVRRYEIRLACTGEVAVTVTKVAFVRASECRPAVRGVRSLWHFLMGRRVRCDQT